MIREQLILKGLKLGTKAVSKFVKLFFSFIIGVMYRNEEENTLPWEN